MAALWSRTFSCVKLVATNLARSLSRDHRFPNIGSCRMCNSCSRPTLRASPRVGMADEFLDIRATGLKPGQSVVLHGEVDTECGRHRFRSRALYIADESGEVDVRIQPSLGGTYTGIDPMGLIWSVTPDVKDSHLNPRLVKTDPSRPLKYTIRLTDGETKSERNDERKSYREFDSLEVERHYLAPYVQKVEVEDGLLKGTLYIPRKNDSSVPAPLIIGMTGVGPVTSSERGSLLASHGFAVFTLDYFHAIKDYLVRGGNVYLDSKLFFDIVNLAEEHPCLDADRIGMLGACYGGCLAANVVSRNPELPIRCLQLHRSTDFLGILVGLRMPDGSLVHPAQEVDEYSSIVTDADGSLWFQTDHLHPIYGISQMDQSIAPAEHISIPTSLLICGDDIMCPTAQSMNRIASRMSGAGRGDLIDLHYFVGAGHLLATPFIPHCKQSRVALPHFPRDRPVFVKWGGDPYLHAKAQVAAWKKTICFFRRHLGPVEMYRHDWTN